MSAADAWDEYEHLNYAEEPDMEHVERAFMAGYRRALEDAAAATYSEHFESWLRARAAATAPDPRETKD